MQGSLAVPSPAGASLFMCCGGRGCRTDRQLSVESQTHGRSVFVRLLAVTPQRGHVSTSVWWVQSQELHTPVHTAPAHFTDERGGFQGSDLSPETQQQRRWLQSLDGALCREKQRGLPRQHGGSTDRLPLGLW